MKKFLFSGVLPVAIFTFCLSFALAIPEEGDLPELKQSNLESASIQVIHPEPYFGAIEIEAVGVVKPLREVTLSSELSGRVLRVSPNLKIGGHIAEGELLLELDTREFRHELDLLHSATREAKSDIETARTESELTEASLKIAQQVLELRKREHARQLEVQSKNAASLSVVDTAHELVFAAGQSVIDLRRTLATLQGQIRQATIEMQKTEARVAKLQLNLERSKIVAPFAGVVSFADVEASTRVQAGQKLLVLQDCNILEVCCNLIPEQVLEILGAKRPDMLSHLPVADAPQGEFPRLPATISFRHRSGSHRWQGSLSRCEGVGFDNETRTMPCRVAVSNRISDDGVMLTPGMFVDVALALQPQSPLLTVPSMAVGSDRTLAVVDGERLKKLQVQVMQSQGRLSVIRCEHETLSPTSMVIAANTIHHDQSIAVSNIEILPWNESAVVLAP